MDAYAKLLLGTGEITEKTGPVGINSAIDLLSALDGADMAAEAAAVSCRRYIPSRTEKH